MQRIPGRTGDARRWPDCGDGGKGLYDYTIGLDPDLSATVIAAWPYTANADVEGLWAFVNVFDAAIDEQDRRRGITPRPAVREC
jgi:hypothetical protein